ncbi:hypothetical protein [Paucibacter sp. Y2R2-4]|uniref:hypothetical protein n=1 Tax=Paucibacter sp. Y2R2-4 TaxID=2893553 RepID=UPI0021E36C85|nr:hypothetical protein [Paucibacter sp. Y2R2-4]MCV2351267.1 hypothetical protein [Paucibacter sp. Y2R2-4]
MNSITNSYFNFSRLRLRGAGAIFVLNLWALGLHSVQAQTLVPDETSAQTLQCLVKPGAAPAFPERMLEQRLGAFLRVKLVFTHPERAPRQELLFRSGAQEHQDEMERYLNNYRLPCLKPGQTIEAVQEFNFDPDKFGSVHWNDLRHSPNSSGNFDYACIKTAERKLSHFEDQALSSNIKRKANGNVIASMRFTRPNAPPEVKILYDNGNANWRNSVLEHLSEYRVTCPVPEGEAIVFEQQFSYAASTRSYDYALKDTDIVKFLGFVKDIDKQKVNFDLDSMACPFEVVWGVGMPAIKNRVGQVGAPNPNRLEFIAWLETLTLNVGPDVFDQILGNKFKIYVPCGKINLGD